jgi:serine/threonine protein phosphatase PrpC
MKLKATYYTHQGDRANNEDAMLIDKELVQSQAIEISSKKFENDKAVFAVADGMGGENKGEEASYLVLNQFIQEYKTLYNKESILQTIQNAKKRLDSEVQKDNSKLNFGSTIAGVLLNNDKAIIFNCGDSRVYRLSGHFLEQISHDHSYVQTLVDDGVIENEEVNENPYRNILTSAIVGDLDDTMPDIEIKTLNLEENETFVICSDGVWEAVSLEEMEACFQEKNSIECLIEKINVYENRDNFSVIVVEVER